MMEEVVGILNEAPQFGFSVYDVVEHENETDIPVVCYPEINSDESLLNGKVLLQINYAVSNIILTCENTLESPTWKDMLNEINFTIKNNNSGYADLHTFDIVNSIDDGMGYQVEAVLI